MEIQCLFQLDFSSYLPSLLLRLLAEFLPARRYASAGNSDRNVSVRHAPVLCQNEES